MTNVIVILHVYNVTNSANGKKNNTVMQINKIFKDGIGLGGIFHSAVQVYGDQEWSFGYCEHGPGVFSCPSTKNPMYTYRESIKLGRCSFSVYKVNQILRDMRRDWPGYSYDLLEKNCNHFCDEFVERLGVPKIPGWVIRFAHAGVTAAELAGNTAYRLRQAKTEIVSASKVAYRFLAGVASNSNTMATNSSSPGESNSAWSGFHTGWLMSIISPAAKPSSSSDLEIMDEDVIGQNQKYDAPRLNSAHDT